METRETVVIFGAGGHAKSVISAIEAGDRYRIAGLVEEEPARVGDRVMGHAIIGAPDILAQLLADGIRRCVIAVGDNRARARLAAQLSEQGFDLASVIHPAAWIAPGCHIDAGCFVHTFATLGPDCRLGQGVIVSAQAVVGHDCRLGDWAQVTPGVRIGGNAAIGEGVFLGMGCSVLPKVRIGANASIGANSVVHRDVPENAVLVGNPARTIRRA